MKLTSHKKFSKKITSQKVHDGWENTDEICTSGQKRLLGQLGVNPLFVSASVHILDVGWFLTRPFIIYCDVFHPSKILLILVLVAYHFVRYGSSKTDNVNFWKITKVIYVKFHFKLNLTPKYLEPSPNSAVLQRCTIKCNLEGYFELDIWIKVLHYEF